MSDAPLFTALATSSRQLYSLLRCIAFNPQAVVSITPDGLRFTTEEVHAVQASTLLDKLLFSSYLLSDQDATIPPFRINIIALLETLQIFGISDSASSHKAPSGGITSSYAAAFHTPALGLGGTCKITYSRFGAPLCITIEENGVKTTCDMNTYNLPNMYDADENEIPLDRNALVMKIIMPAFSLHDAISELASTSSETLVVSASSIHAPYFALEGHGGPFGDSTVDFAPASTMDGLSTARRVQPAATETFSIAAPSGSGGRVKERYKFDLIKKAGRAMALASKVSFRMDRQGVLSLQFMVEQPEVTANATTAYGGPGGFSFIDYRFVPLVGEDNDDDHGDDEDETYQQDEEDEAIAE
ncbi:checkpoint clamp complex protein Rad1 [Lithohypha guttulata]|uniref:Checkpoint clamp complex protein Rad1 n=1 Tax=Lithohypha guttulata TaxID=1690604 RepID=A0AAN7T738_9EURO|nr:checkpoint clamp complex protein Rad1 [Lithohypha guttulata]KAK5091598.1 checkpoint clamp complex protein Rad1 [Lithohypha guttulata]